MTDLTDEMLSGRTLGEFLLLDRIDEGGFGAVYRARQEGLARPVVVKVLHARAPTGDASLQRLVREAQLACRVDHPYAVHVYAFGVEDDGLLWIAMELVDGVSLEEWLEQHGPMPPEVFLPFFERVAQVVHAAHERGIVHRDLKPANIMVIERGGRLFPKLLDFGVAKLIDDITGRSEAEPSSRPDDSLTPASWTIGSPSYMAPEQWTDPASAGPAADIYSLGVVAYEALTGRRPFRGDSIREIGVQHCKGSVPPAPAPLRRALAKAPWDRPDSAIEFAAALRSEATRSRVRRIGIGVALAMVAIVVGAVQFRAMYETRLAQQRAEAAEHEARATTLTAELEQGRAALLSGDLSGARLHLGEAWRRGDHSRTTQFMLDRAEQPLRAELARLDGHGRMWSASWSPDGRYIATSDDAGAQIWDGTTYARLATLPHGDTVYAAVWAGPGRLVTACGDGAVRVWDVGGKLVRELRLKGRNPRWYAVAVSGGRVAAVDAKGAIAAAWEAGTGAVLVEIPLSGAGSPLVAFSADGRWLAVSGGDAAWILDAVTWHRALGVGEQVRAIAWDPTGPRLLTGGADGDASLWTIPDGARQPHQFSEAVTAVAFAPDGSRAAIGGGDGAEQFIDTSTGRIVAHGNYLHASVVSLAFSADAQRIAATGASGVLTIGDAASSLPVATIENPGQQLWSASFGPAGRVLAASWNGTARIWEARSSYRQWSTARLSGGFGAFGGVEPDGRYLAIVCPGCATRVWDTARDRLLAELPTVTDPRADAPVPFAASRNDRATIARGAMAEIYGLPGGWLIRAVAHVAPVTAVAFTADGALLSGDAVGTVLETSADGITIALAAHHDAGIDALVVLPDGRIAAADGAGRVKIFDGSSTATVAIGTAGVHVRMLRVAPDGRSLLVIPFHAGKTAPMVLVGIDRGVLAKLDAPPVYAARWVDAGNAILSAHADGSARLWNAHGALIRTYTGGARFLADATLSPDGAMVIGGGGDGLLRFWDTATGKPLWVVAAHRPYVMSVHFEGTDIVTRGIGGEVARWHIPARDAAIGGGNYANPLPKT